MKSTIDVCNSDNMELRSINTPFEVLIEALRKPCHVHGYMHSLTNPSDVVIAAAEDLTAYPDMPIRRARDYIAPYCSHPSLFNLDDDTMKCSKCHDVILRRKAI